MGRRLNALPLFLCVLWLAGSAGMRAQGGTGTVTGTVYDNVGVVPGATVTATMAATSTVRTTTTNEVGLFRFAALAPGRYVVKVEMTGYKPLTVEEFAVLAADTRDLGRIVLQPGGVQESVSVIAQITPVQVSESSRKQGITSDQITNITMKGRDIYGFLTTLPGVQDANLTRDFTDWNSAKQITINGAPVNNKNVMIDGIPQIDEGGSGNAYVNPNMDAVGEVQVIANGFTAENGRSNGGLVNFVTKSGTTQFKGAGWYNARRDAWNKNDYVRIRNGTAKPLYRVNIGGFAIGGPVIIPGVLDSRSSERKVFFFVSQEYTKDARPSALVTANYPTERERAGDFSDTRLTTAGANYGAVQPIIDPRTGQQFPGNVIPPDRIHPIGQKLLNLLAKPNGYVNPIATQAHNANFLLDQTPYHDRIDHVVRGDVVLTKNVRFSTRFLADRENNIANSWVSPGIGQLNNFVPAWMVASNATWVINPTMVNEVNGGFAINHYGFEGYPNPIDYTQYYCFNVGVCAPRINPFGEYKDPPKNCCALRQQDQYPYVTAFSTSGGNRTNLVGYNVGPTPRENHNWRYVFQEDLSKTIGRHALKFGTYSEISSKTEPGSGNYMGNFNFGSATTNPLDSGNGYANALLGNFQTYTETTVRVDKDVRHWSNEAYAQDSWRINSRLTLDYGMRFTHNGAYYEVNHMTAAFYPELFDPARAPRIYQGVCTTGAAGSATCSAANQRAIDPLNPSVLLPQPFIGSFVPGTGDQLNGMKADGRNNNGNYWDYPFLVAAPRVGIAWDVNGDGRSAIRASAGVFYNFPRGAENTSSLGQPQFIGQPPVSFNNVIRNGNIDDITRVSTGEVTFQANPISSALATLDGKRYRLPISYNANLAYQRDLGFNTVAEVAYVGNFIRHDIRYQDQETTPLYLYADPRNQFNGNAINESILKTLPGFMDRYPGVYQYPGMGSITDTVNDVTSLTYHSVQFSVQRRLSAGLQMGLAYTLSKGMGMQGWDAYTADPNLTMNNVGGTSVQGGDAALKARYWGPTNVDRRHNLVFNYSYQIPTPFKSNQVLKVLLSDWQLSGVTKWITGTTVNPNCTSNNTGIANTNPSLTGVTARCTLTGAPINAGTRVDLDPSNPDLLTAQYFNIAAFRFSAPLSDTVGNFGNTPLDVLRNPSFSNWDLTLARRIPVKIGRNGGVRVQFQAYNIFNAVRFTTMNAALPFTGANNGTLNSTTAATLGTVIPPRQMGLTIRLDF